MSKTWDNELALKWTNMVWPSRPSISDLYILKNYADVLRKKYNRRLKILILGSTPEFRDFAFEENMMSVVVDKNPSYHHVINREIRHKDMLGNPEFERVVFESWEKTTLSERFDLIVGDLVVGNIDKKDLDSFLLKISSLLEDDGLFIQKSIYSIPRDKQLSSEEIVELYYKKYLGFHPYSYLTHAISMNVVDEDNMMRFNKLYDELVRLFSLGILKKEEMDYFNSIGIDKEMGFLFHMIPIDEYEHMVEKYFNIHEIKYGIDIDSKFMPIHILSNKKSVLFGGKK